LVGKKIYSQSEIFQKLSKNSDWSSQSEMFQKLLVEKFFPANQRYFKSFLKALIGWKKPPLKKAFSFFGHVNRITVNSARG